MSTFVELRKQYKSLGSKRAELRRAAKLGEVDPALIASVQAEMDKLTPRLKAAKPTRPALQIDVDKGATIGDLNERIDAQREIANTERCQLLKLVRQRDYLVAVEAEKKRLKSLSPAERAALQYVTKP